jgi:Cu+-exporting ATPase
MKVDLDGAGPSLDHDGRHLRFCSAGCRDKFKADPDAFAEAVDPVCAMKVDRAAAEHVASSGGARHYFCSAGCEEQFTADPDAFLGNRPAP